MTATWNRRRFEPLAAFGVREQLSSEEKVHLQTSPIMHKRLGVEPPKKLRAASAAVG